MTRLATAGAAGGLGPTGFGLSPHAVTSGTIIRIGASLRVCISSLLSANLGHLYHISRSSKDLLPSLLQRRQFAHGCFPLSFRVLHGVEQRWRRKSPSATVVKAAPRSSRGCLVGR